MQHKCPKCEEVKDVRDFRRNTKHAGYELWNLRICKTCVHQEYLDRVGDSEKHEKMLASTRKYRKSNPEKHAANARRYRKKHKDKIRATAKLNYAIKMGRIERQPCCVCNSEARIHAHHDSYAPGKEYEVRWLCGDHHALWHRMLDTMTDRIGLNDKFTSFLKSLG